MNKLFRIENFCSIRFYNFLYNFLGEPQKLYLQAQKLPDSVKSTQLKLAVSPNSKQINILQPAGGGSTGKKIYQIINSSGLCKT